MYTTLENTPLTIDLTLQALSTGWSLTGSHGIHEACNAGVMTLLNFPLVSGQAYTYTYRINSISGGNVQARLGTANGTANTTPGFKVETVTATGTNPMLSFFSNADCDIDILSIQQVLFISTATKQRNTIVYNEKVNKWTSYYSYIADIGFMLFTNLFTAKNGILYLHESNTDDRCEFYGIQYDAIVKMVSNRNAVVPQSYESISLQSNELMVTTDAGITTSPGQISELAQQDFIKQYLDDGVSSVNIFDYESVYAASFLRDMNEDLESGTPLKGNYIIVELVTTNSNAPLRLFTAEVISSHSAVGSR